MSRILLFVVVFELAMVGWSFASDFETELTVGENSINGSLQYKKHSMNGYWKVGGAGLYTDKDNVEYKWLDLDLAVGSETMLPGLGFEIGFRGLLGDAERIHVSGDVGALAFSGRVSYTFSRELIYIPIEIYAGTAYAPQILSFRDTENVFIYTFGVAVFIIDNAAIITEYNAYDLTFSSDDGDKDLYDNEFRFGLKLLF